jgi:ABC-type nitrate/sulfonate/bicarbonate transport system substrate-binding protein
MRFALWTAALVLSIACSAQPATPGRSSAGGERAASPPASRPLERVRVAYGAPSAAFAAPWLAKDAGLFDKYGLDAELTYIASGPTLLQSMIAGEIDFGELAAPSSMNAFLEGGEVVWITEAVNRPVLLLIARPEIARFEDLRGRPVGVTRIGTTTHTFMKIALRNVGMDPEADVQILQTGGTPETVAALETGRIFGAVSGPPNHLRALEAGMRVLVDLAELGIPWPFAGTITTKRYIAAHPDAVQGYVKAYAEALHLLRTDRERSVAVIMKYAELTDRGIAEQSWEMFRPYYAALPYPDAAAMQAAVDEELAATNPRAREVPPQAYYDDRFVRELEESGFARQLHAP